MKLMEKYTITYLLSLQSRRSWCMDHLIGWDIKVDERIISIKMQASSSNRVRLPRVNHKILRVGVNILIFPFSPLARKLYNSL